MVATTDKIVKACEDAKDKLLSLGIEEQLVSELEWCLGSYAHDSNPDGLYLKGEEALKALEKYKKSNPRKVSKKLIDDLTKAIKAK
jgi:hypothetical protein